MTKDEIVRYALSGYIPDVQMTCPERALFFTLKEIYSNYRRGLLSKEKGEALKLEALRQFNLDKGVYDSAMKILRQNAEMWKAIELTGSAYRTDRTLEKADQFVEAVFNCGMLQKEGGALC